MSRMGEGMNGDRRVQLEQRAEAVRSSLERRLDALDERRDQVLDLAQRITRPPVVAVLIGAASLVGVALVVRRREKRPGRRQRFGAAVLGVPARQPKGFFAKAFERAALSLVATLVQRVGTRGLDRLLPEAAPPTPSDMPRPGL